MLEQIVERASALECIDGVIVIGSFAGGEPDALSDLDVVVVAARDRLDEAWAARRDLAGDVFLTWEPQSNEGRDIRWFNWLTHDLVKVECGIGAPGSKELAEPFTVVHGRSRLAAHFPRTSKEAVEERLRQRTEQQSLQPNSLSPEERLGWALSEMKHAAREVRRRSARRG